MIAPDGFMIFEEIADWAREVARDLAWAKRTVKDDDGYSLKQMPGERDAVECWAMAKFLSNTFAMLCSTEGVAVRAPSIISKHLDQIEMLPIPIPIEESSLQMPKFGKNFELEPHYFFRDRFAYFDWHTGCISTTKAESEGLIGSRGDSQFSKASTKYLLNRQSHVTSQLAKFEGWSICANEKAIGPTMEELYGAFGVDEALLAQIELDASGYFAFFGESHKDRLRKRDRALQAYQDKFPNGHEITGVTLKEATNEVSEIVGAIVSVDTMRRALGRKK